MSSIQVVDQRERMSHACPQCSREMESGYVLTPSAFAKTVRWSPVWMRDVDQEIGAEIAPANYDGDSIRMAGFRCEECRLLVLSY